MIGRGGIAMGFNQPPQTTAWQDQPPQTSAFPEYGGTSRLGRHAGGQDAGARSRSQAITYRVLEIEDRSSFTRIFYWFGKIMQSSAISSSVQEGVGGGK